MSIKYYKSLDGNDYAIKNYKNKGNQLVPDPSAVREIIYLSRFKHKNIISVNNILIDDNEVIIIMPRLQYDLSKLNNINENTGKLIFYNILKGLEYIHNMGLIHRDIKPENILCNLDLTEIKICDLGSVRHFPLKCNLDEMSSEGMSPIYDPPELIFTSYNYIYNQSVDIWSLGCTMWELLFKSYLFPATNYRIMVKQFIEILGVPDYSKYKNILPEYLNIHERLFSTSGNLGDMVGSNLINKIKNKEISDGSNPNGSNLNNKIKNKEISEDLRDIFMSIFQYDIDKRPKSSELVSHKYFLEHRQAENDNIEMKDIVNSTQLSYVKSNVDIAVCYWISAVVIDFNYNIKILIDTIMLYHNINRKLDIKKADKQAYSIACLSLIVDLSAYEYESVEEYVRITDNSVTAEHMNACRIKILQNQEILNIDPLIDASRLSDSAIIIYLLFVIMDKYNFDELLDICNNPKQHWEVIKELCQNFKTIISQYHIDDIDPPFGLKELINNIIEMN